MPDYNKPDHLTLKAQKEGYPARSVYKLKEMDEKFGLLKKHHKAFKVLDLGAAPGSWSLYIMRKLDRVSLVSVDLSALSRQSDKGLFDRPDFIFLQGDFTESKIREAIIAHGPYDLLVSDAAPATSGNRSLDTLRSLELAENALVYAEAALAAGGNFVVKVFQGGDTGNLLKRMRDLFNAGKSFKPQACRSESFETYYLGLGKIKPPAQDQPLFTM
jgi:23S rRNA (uridine2552-2'-O)-methyltransferase